MSCGLSYVCFDAVNSNYTIAPFQILAQGHHKFVEFLAHHLTRRVGLLHGLIAYIARALLQLDPDHYTSPTKTSHLSSRECCSHRP
jgi:hypothetical protein